jgi:hypothetical protein
MGPRGAIGAFRGLSGWEGLDRMLAVVAAAAGEAEYAVGGALDG